MDISLDSGTSPGDTTMGLSKTVFTVCTFTETDFISIDSVNSKYFNKTKFDNFMSYCTEVCN